MFKVTGRSERGFTLIEIMIVIVIIGILVAIAIPQFVTYRLRSYNSVAKALVHNLKSDNANLNAELGVYGHTESTPAILSAADAGIGTSDTRAVPGLAVPATSIQAGARLSARTSDAIPRSLAIPVSLGNIMVAACLDINNASYQSSYNVFSRHIKGDSAYAIDVDVENSIYSVSNPQWPNLAGLQALTVNPTLNSSNDVSNMPGGGAPSTVWTLSP